MRRLYFGTRNLVILAVMAMTFSTGCGGAIFRHDHALFFTGSTPSDDAIYCGVVGRYLLGEEQTYPYTLYISATAIGRPGTFTITFTGSRTMPLVFPVSQGDTVSTTLPLGTRPNVDHVVKITPQGGVQSMMASVAVRVSGDILIHHEDPFDERPAQSDNSNFCVTASREPGSASAAQMFP